MRIAVHHPERKQGEETIPASVSAFRVGRIIDHTDVLTGATIPREKVAEILLDQAKDEFPDCEVVIEHLHDNGDGTSSWKDHAPGEGEAPAPAGDSHEAPPLEVAQPQAMPGASQ